jgi:hypothetical protein
LNNKTALWRSNLTETAARELYDLILKMNLNFRKGSGEKALEAGDLGTDFAALIVNFSGLTRDVRDEIMRADFPNEGRFDTLIERLSGIQKDVMNALSKRGVGGTTGPLVEEIVAERALSVAEQIENAGVSSVSLATRQDMMKATEELIAEVKKWDLEDYAKRTLLIQLNHVTRVIQAADTYSASELRFRVKAIIADFASEFTQMDKKHQTKLERLVLWGRRGFFAGTIFLGLTADATSIMAALPPPTKLLGSS